MPHTPLRTSLALVCGGAILVAGSLMGAGTSFAAHVGHASPGTAMSVTWMKGFAAPGTPVKYNKVGVLKIGPKTAKNVLVLEPGTSAGSAYFAPLAKWIVSKSKGWQVWSVERRENLLEDQSQLNAYKRGVTKSKSFFDYYLGYLKDPSITPHFHPLSSTADAFAKQWGMNVAVQDLHVVVAAANKLGGKVVLGGHSLGGSVVTAYATWSFAGKPGASALAGLVYVDGGSGPTAISATDATSALAALNAPSASPWLNFGGIIAPYAGVFVATGAATALRDPNTASAGQASGLLPKDLVPPVTVSNAGQFGYALNTVTSPPVLAAAQAHLGAGLSAAGPVHGWDSTGALTPLARYATMFSGYGVNSADGAEWYFPQRLTDDTGGIADGNANPAQAVLGEHATLGHSLPHTLRIYAFGAALGGSSVLTAAQTLATQSGIPSGNLTLVDGSATYAHNDPNGAFPTNLFFKGLVPFLKSIAP